MNKYNWKQKYYNCSYQLKSDAHRSRESSEEASSLLISLCVRILSEVFSDAVTQPHSIHLYKQLVVK